MSARTDSFPVLSTYAERREPGAIATVPWIVAERAYNTYKQRYPSSAARQSLERIAERGGFSAAEFDDLHPMWRQHAASIPPEPPMTDTRAEGELIVCAECGHYDTETLMNSNRLHCRECGHIWEAPQPTRAVCWAGHERSPEEVLANRCDTCARGLALKHSGTSTGPAIIDGWSAPPQPTHAGREEAATLRSFVGAAPSLTGGVDAVEYVRRQREGREEVDHHAPYRNKTILRAFAHLNSHSAMGDECDACALARGVLAINASRAEHAEALQTLRAAKERAEGEFRQLSEAAEINLTAYQSVRAYITTQPSLNQMLGKSDPLLDALAEIEADRVRALFALDNKTRMAQS